MLMMLTSFQNFNELRLTGLSERTLTAMLVDGARTLQPR